MPLLPQDQRKKLFTSRIAQSEVNTLAELEYLRQDLSRMALQLGEVPAPLKLMRVYSTDEFAEHIVPDSGFTSRTIAPAPATRFNDGCTELRVPPPNDSASFTVDSGNFTCLPDARIVGARPSLFFSGALIDDALCRHLVADEFDPYGAERLYAGLLYFYTILDSGERWVIVHEPLVTRTLSHGILLHGNYQANFWHWLCEYVIHVPAILALPEKYQQWPLLLSREAFKHPNLQAVLQRLINNSSYRIEIIEVDEVVCVERLMVPPRLSWVKSCLARADMYPRDCMLEPIALQKLHAALALPPNGKQRFFLMRKNNPRLRNQDEIQRIFVDCGFTVIDPESLDFEASRYLFAQAEIIAGATGAAFTNLIYCPSKTRAIIFVADLYPEMAIFSAIATALNQQVIHIPCVSHSMTLSDNSFSVNPRHVLQALKILGIAEGETHFSVSPLTEKERAPLVSILIPAYKARWFEEALQSALAQDYPNTELIVFDNCPTEAIREICTRYPHVHYWRNPHVRLQNIIDVACFSKGRYIKYLFDDDLLEPNCVSELVGAIERFPETKIAFARSWQIDENSQRQELRFPPLNNSAWVTVMAGNSVCRNIAKIGNFIGEFSSILLDGEWLRANPQHLYRGARSQKHYAGLVDMICFINAAVGSPVGFVNAPLSSFRQNTESNSNPDQNPDFVAVCTDMRLIIEEVALYGLLTHEDMLEAQENYNQQVVLLTRLWPSLANKIWHTRFPEEAFPAVQHYQHCEALLHEGRQDEALTGLLGLVEQKITYWKIYIALAQFAEQAEQLDVALKYYKVAKLQHPYPALEDALYIRLLIKLGNYTEAWPYFAAYSDAFPDHANTKELTLISSNLPQFHYLKQQEIRRIGGLSLDDYHVRLAKLTQHPPRFEIILIVHPDGFDLLNDCVSSLTAQAYSAWQLSVFSLNARPAPQRMSACPQLRWFTVDASVTPLADVLQQHLAQSEADWIGLFPNGTRFTPASLFEFASYALTHPEWQLMYSDEALLANDGQVKTLCFKPDFNLEFLRASDYIGHVFAQRALLQRAGGYANTSVYMHDTESYDLLLRLVDACHEAAVGHIQEILTERPTASRATNYQESAICAVQAHLQRRGITADVQRGLLPEQNRRVLYTHLQQPKVSIIIHTRNRLDLLGACIESILRTTSDANWEIIIVDNGSDDPNMPAYYAALQQMLLGRVHIINFAGDFNYSAMNNAGADLAQGEYLLLLNNDTVCIQEKWLEALMHHALRPEVGIVGARLLFPQSQKVQHAGVIVGMGGMAAHVFDGLDPNAPSYLGRLQTDQELSAVTGACLLIRKTVFKEVGGFDAENMRMVYNDIDLCLKVREKAYRIIWTPFATLLHHGSATLKNAINVQDAKEKNARIQQEKTFFAQKWLPQYKSDPAWNRNLALYEADPHAETELLASWNPDFADRPRILMIPSSNKAVASYRQLAPLKALHAAQAIYYTSACMPSSSANRIPLGSELMRMAPTSLVMHAPIDDARCMALLDYQAINLDVFRIYSLDDLISALPHDNPSYHKLPADEIRERLRLGLSASHRLIVSTEPLAAAYCDLIDDIRVIPNSLDSALWHGIHSQRRRGKKIRVGWAGAQQHAGDLRFLRDVIEATHQSVDWIFMGLIPDGVTHLVSEVHEFERDFYAYPSKLAALDLDLALAPLEIHPFNEAKSNLKLLEYGILGWPVIATDIYPYQQNNPPITRLANRAEQWIRAISERVGAFDALAHEGDTLRDWVRKHYLLEQHLEHWRKAWLP